LIEIKKTDFLASLASPPSTTLSVRANAHDEVIARAANLLVGRAVYETARRLYPQDRIDYRCRARVIERSDETEN